jgi:uncharacterized protein DUF1876
MQEKTWHITVSLSEDGDRTQAEAVLRTDAGRELRHTGIARRSPQDPDVPLIGDELATCRALDGLARDLLDASIADVERNVHRKASITL